MKCYNPTLCYNDRDTHKRLFRSWDMATDAIKQTDHILFNCGKCIFCLKKRALELARRCVLHASCYLQNSFLTLTYDETKPGYHNNLDYKNIQDFKKSLRSYVTYHYGKTIEIFNVHEYGKLGKKHWHLVVFNFDFDDKTVHTYKNNIPLYKSEELNKIWKHGFCSIGDVTEASAMYQAQYTQKDVKNGNRNNSKKAKSNHSGIGFKYFDLHWRSILYNGYISFGGQKMPVPRSFIRRAHKHYCHFADQTAFFDTQYRKKIYTPFKPGQENLEIANAYKYYVTIKKDKIKQWEEEWNNVIMQEFDDKKEPDFRKSAENYLHDFNNKIIESEF